MTVTYRSSRREVAALYAYLWRRSHRLKVNQAFIAAGAYVIARAARRAPRWPSARRWSSWRCFRSIL